MKNHYENYGTGNEMPLYSVSTSSIVSGSVEAFTKNIKEKLVKHTAKFKGALGTKKENINCVAGLFCAVIALKLFINPLDINIGGFAGLYAILNKLFGFSNTFSAVVLNAVPFIWAYRHRGINTIIRTIAVTFLFSSILDLVPDISYQTSQLLTVVMSLVGSVLAGLGFGLILLGNASTGGSDFLGLLINDKFKKIPVGMAMVMVNLTIVVLTMFVSGVSAFFLSVVSMSIVNITIGIMIEPEKYNVVNKIKMLRTKSV